MSAGGQVNWDSIAPRAQAGSGAGAVNWDAIAPKASPSQGRPDTSGSMALDFMQAGGAELIGTALGAYNLIRKIPGADKVLPAISPDVQQYAEPPKTAAAKLGRIFTELGEFAIPAGEVGAATKGASLGIRALTQGAAAGGTQLVRSGGNLPSAADAAAMGAAGPVAGAALGAAAPVAGRVLKAAPGLAADVIGTVHPKLGNAVRVAIKAYQALSKGAEAAAPGAAAAAKTAGQLMTEAGGQEWNKLSADEQQFMEQIAKAQLSRAQGAAPAAAPAGPPAAYQPRPPEYYGVKPQQTPPAAAEAPPQPAQGAPAPAQPASAAPSALQPNGGPLRPPMAPPAPPPVVTPEPPPAAPPAAKPASAAMKANSQAKADRFVEAIRRFNADNPQQALSAEELAGAGDEEKSMLTRGLKQGGYLGNTEKFPDTSFPYIVSKLKDAEAAASQTIKPPEGFSLGNFKQYPPEAASPAPRAIDSTPAIQQNPEVTAQETPAVPAPASPAPSAIAPKGPITHAPEPTPEAVPESNPTEPATGKAVSVDFGKEVTNNGRKEMTVRGVGDDDKFTGDYVKVKQVSGRTGEYEVVQEYYAKPPGPENRYGHMETRNIGGTYTKAQAKEVAEGFLKGTGNPYEAIEKGLPFSEYKPGSGNLKYEQSGFMKGGFPHNTIPSGEDAWTDGRVAFTSKAPGPIKTEGSQPDMTKVWTQGIKEADTPVNPVGFYQQAGEQKVVLSNQAGVHTLVDRKYFDYARKTFKDVSFAARDNKSAIAVYSGGKPVGLIMPMRLEAGDLPAGIKPLLKAPK